jgi:hypothetical protein
MGSPSRSTTMTNGLPFAAASPEEKLIYFGELQLKIRAAFVREERLLAKVGCKLRIGFELEEFQLSSRHVFFAGSTAVVRDGGAFRSC